MLSLDFIMLMLNKLVSKLKSNRAFLVECYIFLYSFAVFYNSFVSDSWFVLFYTAIIT